jgi:hypothetical protein
MNSYTVDDITYTIAKESDNEALQQLLNENEMSSWVAISLEKKPDYFASQNLMGESITVIAYAHEQKVIGMYSGTYYEVFVSHKVETILYLGSLRVNTHYRHKIKFLKEGFRSIKNIFLPSTTLPYMLTSIASENHKAIKLLEGNVKGMPQYQFLSQLSTFAFKAKSSPLTMAQLITQEEIPLMVDFYNRHARQYDFAPTLRMEWLQSLNGNTGLSIKDFYIVKDSSGAIKAMFALWDQRKIKQTLIRGYSPRLSRPVRFLYNVYATLSGNVVLPNIAEAIEQIYISFFISASNDNDWNIRLLREASSLIQQRGADVCIIAFDSKDPMCEAIQRRLKPKQYLTHIDGVFLGQDMAQKITVGILKPEAALL